MAIKKFTSHAGLIWIILGMGFYLDAWQRLHTYHEGLNQQQVYASQQARERKKMLQTLAYSQEFLLKTWLHDAQVEGCQVIKIHPWVRDPKIQHFSLFLTGEYPALLKWLKRVEQDLPHLKWEKLSLGSSRGLKLELVVDCYARI